MCTVKEELKLCFNMKNIFSKNYRELVRMVVKASEISNFMFVKL